MPTPCVILFLDFDGVLHPVGGLGVESNSRQRMKKLPLLEALLREPALRQVGMVVSSTWRVIYTPAQLRSMFAPDIRERLVGCTPQLTDYRTRHPRSEEIAAWLAVHPEVRAWVAVDDHSGAFAPQVHGQIVFTDPHTGLMPRDIEALRTQLLAAIAQAEGGAASQQ